MWSNLHLLFWLSLFAFTTGWMGENHFAALPTAVYGAVLIMAGIAWWILQSALVAVNGRDSALARAIGSDVKGRASLALYALGVALMWLIPDRRIERAIDRG
jgi:uncharacterized membrane protein